ncbi:MAG: diaminopimelate epimerase [Pseudomonadota bacterium]
MSASLVPFLKMNGIGNQIIVADMRGRADTVTPDAARALAQDSKTHFDQLMAVHDSSDPTADARMIIYNADGSKAEACGNGTRCVGRWLAEETGKNRMILRSVAGNLDTTIRADGRISVVMGVPRFDWDQIPLSEEFADTRGIELQVGPIDDPILHTPSVANIGNPHAVFWVDKPVENYDLARFGSLLEHHPLFPEAANISIAQVTSANSIIMRTWERGVGLTLACGSAACATAVCAARKSLTEREVTVRLPGGELDITWREDGFIVMTGAAEEEFRGQFDPATGAWMLHS